MANDEILSWDSEISAESQFVLLPEGVYDFTVAKFVKEHFKGSEKMPECDAAALTLRIVTSQGEEALVNTRLFLAKKVEWKLSEFFRCIGQKRHGEPLRPNWRMVEGSRGRVKIVQKPGLKNRDIMFNEVERFLDPEQTTTTSWTAGSF